MYQYYGLWRTLHKKWNFLLRISSVNVAKSAGDCGFGHSYWRILNGKPLFLCSGKEICIIIEKFKLEKKPSSESLGLLM